MESGVEKGRMEKPEAQEAQEQKEGPVARAIESRTAQLPSDVFLWGSLMSMGISLALQLSGKKKMQLVSNFIDQWAPTLLVLGLYNKLVKVAGHDRRDHQ